MPGRGFVGPGPDAATVARAKPRPRRRRPSHPLHRRQRGARDRPPRRRRAGRDWADPFAEQLGPRWAATPGVERVQVRTIFGSRAWVPKDLRTLLGLPAAPPSAAVAAPM